MAEYTTKDYKALLGLPGFSDVLLNNHFTLYDGYVKNTNKLSAELAGLLKDGKTGTPDFAERKRRFGWEFAGMRLHEYYFENLAKSPQPLATAAPKLVKALAAEFGSVEAWESDFRAVGTMRGVGWVVLYLDTRTGRLFNEWVDEHDAGHLPGCAPLLIMDVFEHAFMVDYGLKRADYVAAFMKAVDWKVAALRFEACQVKLAAAV